MYAHVHVYSTLSIINNFFLYSVQPIHHMTGHFRLQLIPLKIRTKYIYIITIDEINLKYDDSILSTLTNQFMKFTL